MNNKMNNEFNEYDENKLSPVINRVVLLNHKSVQHGIGQP